MNKSAKELLENFKRRLLLYIYLKKKQEEEEEKKVQEIRKKHFVS